MYIVRNFVNLSTVPLATMLFKSFIISVITYCLPIFFERLYASDKKRLSKFFRDALSLGLEISSLDNLVDSRTQTLILSYIHDSEHFINDFIEQCPSGRYRTVKYRTSYGKDSFLRHMILKLNEILH